MYPSELVTIGVLFALKGGHFRAFARWLRRDYADLFTGLPDRTRLQRLLQTHQDWFGRFLADPSVFTVIASYPIALIFPIREGRSARQVGRKGKDKGRWTVGRTRCRLLNGHGRVVAWDWAPLNTPDQRFHFYPEAVGNETPQLGPVLIEHPAIGADEAADVPGVSCERAASKNAM